jgi:sporulation protein YlmC with PRC-barrel domain
LAVGGAYGHSTNRAVKEFFMKIGTDPLISTGAAQRPAYEDSDTEFRRSISDHGPGPSIMGASTLTGDEVCDRDGESLGRIEEIMLDTYRGKIAYAVLSCGGFLGIGNKLFAVPWSALELDAGNKRFVLAVDKDRLKEAPGFDKDHWPEMADRAWAQEVHRYYEQDLYWDASDSQFN